MNAEIGDVAEIEMELISSRSDEVRLSRLRYFDDHHHCCMEPERNYAFLTLLRKERLGHGQ